MYLVNFSECGLPTFAIFVQKVIIFFPFYREYKEPTQKLLLVLEYGEIDLDKFIAQNIANDKQLLPSTVFYFWLQMVTAVHAMHKEGNI